MKQYWTFILVAIILMVDQVSKLLVKGFSLFGMTHRGMALGQSIPVLGDVVRITYIENPGMAFGIDFGAAKLFLSLFSILAAIVLSLVLYRLHQRGSPWFIQLAIALIVAGAFGNLIDRVFYGVLYGQAPLFYGQVVDFLDVDIPDIRYGNWVIERWWVFNIADAAITCGTIVLLVSGRHFPPLRELFPTIFPPHHHTDSQHYWQNRAN